MVKKFEACRMTIALISATGLINVLPIATSACAHGVSDEATSLPDKSPIHQVPRGSDSAATTTESSPATPRRAPAESSTWPASARDADADQPEDTLISPETNRTEAGAKAATDAANVFHHDPDGGADPTAPPSDGASGSVTSGPTASQPCHPLINEVSVANDSGPAGEFVELYNPCPVSVPLANWKLVYRSASGTKDILLVDLAPYELPSAGYLVFGGVALTAGTATFGGATGTLSGTAGAVALRQGSERIDSVAYGPSVSNGIAEGEPAQCPPSGQSIARKPNGIDSGHNAHDFAVSVSSPGKAN